MKSKIEIGLKSYSTAIKMALNKGEIFLILIPVIDLYQEFIQYCEDIEIEPLSHSQYCDYMCSVFDFDIEYDEKYMKYFNVKSSK